MPSKSRRATSLYQVASWALLIATVVSGIPLPQDLEDDLGNIGLSSPSVSDSPSRTTSAASPTASPHKPRGRSTSTGGKIAAICIPIVFVLFICWICSPIGPEGKRRRRRREALARLRANLRQREEAEATTWAANAAARAEAAAQENARSRSARQMVYLFTGWRSNQEDLPAYHQAPTGDEVLLAQGSRTALNPPSSVMTPSCRVPHPPLSYPPQAQNAPSSTPATFPVPERVESTPSVSSPISPLPPAYGSSAARR